MVEKTRNYYKTSKKWRDHEKEIALLHAFAADPELKYWLGAMAGLGMGTLSSYLKLDEIGTPGGSTDVPNKVINAYETILGIGSPLLSAAGVFDFNQDGEGGMAGRIFTFGCASATAFNMTCLILRSASGGQGGGMFSKLAGAVV